MTIEYTNDELVILKRARDAVGGSPETPAQLERFGAVAREATESARPLISKVSRTPVQSEAQKTDRIEKLTAMSTSQSFSPSIRKLAAMQLRLMKSGVSEQEAGRQVGQSIIDELNEGREQGKALAALYHNATDEVTRRAVKTAMGHHSDALAASIKEHQNQKRR